MNHLLQISTLSKGGSTKEGTFFMSTCQFKCGNENLFFFCLIFKEYMFNCPSNCSYLIKGPCYTMNYFYQLNVEMECPNLHLIVNHSQNADEFPNVVCGVTGTIPSCAQCPLEILYKEKK